MYGDPDHLDEIARSLEARAVALESHCHEHESRSAQVLWHSTGAEAMRASASAVFARIREVALRYREAASAVRDHARRVREVLAWIEEVERRFRQAVAAAADRLAQAGHAVVRAVDGAVGLVGDAVSEMGSWIGLGEGPEPDPADVRLCQTPMPPSGHRDWLDLAPLAGVS